MAIDCETLGVPLTTWTAFTLWACAAAETRYPGATTNATLAVELHREWVRMSD